MSMRGAKQLIYATFYIVIVVLIIWGGYLLLVHPAPIVTPPPTPQSISVLNVAAFTASAGHDTFLAKVANLNQEYAAESFEYSFNVYDASQTLLDSYSGQSFLYGSQVGYLLLANQAIPSDVSSANLTITNVDWVASATLGAIPQLAVQNLATTVGTSTTAITGEIADNDSATFNNVLIIAVVKDINGNPLGASQTELNTIAPEQTENFSISYPTVPGIDPTQTEVEAYAMRP